MHLLGMSFPFFYRQTEANTTDTPVTSSSAVMVEGEASWKSMDDPGPKYSDQPYWLTDNPGQALEAYSPL